MYSFLDVDTTNRALESVVLSDMIESGEEFARVHKELEEEYNRVVEHFGRGGNPALEKLLIDTKMKVAIEATAKGVPYK